MYHDISRATFPLCSVLLVQRWWGGSAFTDESGPNTTSHFWIGLTFHCITSCAWNVLVSDNCDTQTMVLISRNNFSRVLAVQWSRVLYGLLYCMVYVCVKTCDTILDDYLVQCCCFFFHALVFTQRSCKKTISKNVYSPATLHALWFVRRCIIWGEECERWGQILSGWKVERLEMRDKKRRPGERVWEHRNGGLQGYKIHLPILLIISTFSVWLCLLWLLGWTEK